MADPVTLSKATMQRMAIGKVFKPAAAASSASSPTELEAPVTSIEFHRDGEFCAAASAGGDVRLLSAHTGDVRTTVHSTKYGAELLCFTHSPSEVVVSSRNADDDHDVRYLSLFDNKYLGYFRGHTDRVVSLAMSPCDDTCLTASLDCTARLWDLRSRGGGAGGGCAGVLKVPREHQSAAGFVCAAYDPMGTVFGVLSATSGVRLFDARNTAGGPFTSLPLPATSGLEGGTPTTLQFSPDGNFVLIGTDRDPSGQGGGMHSPVLLRLSAFDDDGSAGDAAAAAGDGAAATHRMYEGHTAPTPTPTAKSFIYSPCFTPDGQFVLSGSADGKVLVWDASTAERVAEWEGHAGPVHCVRWNPARAMAASGCANVAFWLPQNT